MLKALKTNIIDLCTRLKQDARYPFAGLDPTVLSEHTILYQPVLAAILRQYCIQHPDKARRSIVFKLLSGCTGRLRNYASLLVQYHEVLNPPMAVNGFAKESVGALELYQMHQALEDAIIHQMTQPTTFSMTQHDKRNVLLQCAQSQRIAAYSLYPSEIFLPKFVLALSEGNLVTNSVVFVLGWVFITMPSLLVSCLLSDSVFSSLSFLTYFIANYFPVIVSLIYAGIAVDITHHVLRVQNKQAGQALTSTISPTWDDVLLRQSDADFLLIELMFRFKLKFENSVAAGAFYGWTPSEVFCALTAQHNTKAMHDLLRIIAPRAITQGGPYVANN